AELRVAVLLLDLVEESGEIRNCRQVGVIAGRENDQVDVETSAVREPHLEWPLRRCPDFRDLGARAAMDGRCQPGSEPVLERQPSCVPEAPSDLLPLRLAQVPPPPGNRDGALDVRVDEGPADPLEP